MNVKNNDEDYSQSEKFQKIGTIVVVVGILLCLAMFGAVAYFN